MYDFSVEKLFILVPVFDFEPARPAKLSAQSFFIRFQQFDDRKIGWVIRFIVDRYRFK